MCRLRIAEWGRQEWEPDDVCLCCRSAHACWCQAVVTCNGSICSAGEEGTVRTAAGPCSYCHCIADVWQHMSHPDLSEATMVSLFVMVVKSQPAGLMKALQFCITIMCCCEAHDRQIQQAARASCKSVYFMCVVVEGKGCVPVFVRNKSVLQLNSVVVRSLP